MRTAIRMCTHVHSVFGFDPCHDCVQSSFACFLFSYHLHVETRSPFAPALMRVGPCGLRYTCSHYLFVFLLQLNYMHVCSIYLIFTFMHNFKYFAFCILLTLFPAQIMFRACEYSSLL